MYQMLLASGFCIAYFALYFLFPLFFGEKAPRVRPVSFLSLAGIVAMSYGAYLIAWEITDPYWSNRFLHAAGGGFLAFAVCFLAVRDSGLRISRFQFFTFGFLVVTALGVANEMTEFVIQNHSTLVFAKTVQDTWLDLISNTAGAFAGGGAATALLRGSRTGQSASSA